MFSLLLSDLINGNPDALITGCDYDLIAALIRLPSIRAGLFADWDQLGN